MGQESFWAEQIVSSFSRAGKVGEAGKQLKLKKMGDGEWRQTIH